MKHGKKGCQAAPEAPKLCVNRCGLFGNAATMNLCSKCHKDLVLKQKQAKLSSSSLPLMPDCSSIDTEKKPDLADPEASLAESLVSPTLLSPPSALDTVSDIRGKGSPNRCSTCKKRVGLTAFHCRCGSLFCAIHRYSDKHGCAYDYRTAARVAIAKANPVVRAEKLRKI